MFFVISTSHSCKVRTFWCVSVNILYGVIYLLEYVLSLLDMNLMYFKRYFFTSGLLSPNSFSPCWQNCYWHVMSMAVSPARFKFTLSSCEPIWVWFKFQILLHLLYSGCKHLVNLSLLTSKYAVPFRSCALLGSIPFFNSIAANIVSLIINSNFLKFVPILTAFRQFLKVNCTSAKKLKNVSVDFGSRYTLSCSHNHLLTPLVLPQWSLMAHCLNTTEEYKPNIHPVFFF